jgi:hypothetical protein
MRRISTFVGCALAIGVLSQACGGGDSTSNDGGTSQGANEAGSGSDGAMSTGNGDAAMSSNDGSSSTQDGGGTTTEGGGGGVDAGPSPVVGGCAIFPPDDAWNTDVSGMGVDMTWTTNLFMYATNKSAHPDFGSTFGIPFNVVPQGQTPITMKFSVPTESDPGPYPFLGATSKIEGGTPTSCSGDCHVLTLEQGTCLLYEAGACLYSTGNNSWSCFSGAKWDLNKKSEGQRTVGYTSADAAGLPMLPGLVRYDEVAAGEVRHAIRFTMHCTQDGFVPPASHQAVPNQCPGGISQANLRAEYPPMGTRIRLKSGFDISGFSTQAKIVATAMQKYGLILADNGSDYYFQGDPNPGWDDNQLNDLKGIPGDAFEVLTMPTIMR